jgi:hypothetical protein
MGPIVLNHVYHNICIVTMCNILPLLYPETSGSKCAHPKSPSLLSYFSLVYHGFDIQISHPRIQTTHSHTSHCHYCNVDFVVFHNVTCYTNSLLSCIHINKCTPPYHHTHFGCHVHDITEVRIYWPMQG